MSVSKPMYKPEMCDGQPCPGDCDLCSRWQLWEDDEEDEKEKGTPEGALIHTPKEYTSGRKITRRQL